MARRRSNGQGTLFKRTDRGPWIASWFDHTGKRKERSTRTTDKATAQRILAKHVADAALRREGVIDPRKDRFGIENRKPLDQHVEDYLDHCVHAGHADKHIAEKRRHLGRLIKDPGALRLSDLTVDLVERHLKGLRADGLSARTANYCRQVIIAFMNWCVQTGRCDSNPLKVLPKLDERKDRRRVRRPLTDDELARLLAVAEPRARKAWYLAAALAGLRKGDLQRLRWCDLDFDNGTITIHEGKAKRVDVIPMHPQLAEELAARRDQSLTVPTAKVFPQTVTDRTRQKDLQRAGIPLQDEEGRVVDLHGLRTTLGTNLARAGVTPQIAQRIMRHSDYRTTLKHYTILGLTDTAKAMHQLSTIETPDEPASATGTHGSEVEGSRQNSAQQYPQQCVRDLTREGATRRDIAGPTPDEAGSRKDLKSSGKNDDLRDDAKGCEKAGEGTRTLNIQLGKLALYH